MAAVGAVRQADPPPELSAAAAEAVDVIAAFHEEHYGQATPLQNTVDRATSFVARPATVLALLVAFILWGAAAYLAGDRQIDHPAFAWLGLSATLLALFVSLIILVTQRREDQLAERRAQLILELALLSDRKVAKAIALLEDLRRDAPDIEDRQDPESEEMAQPTDASAVLAAIDERSAKGS